MPRTRRRATASALGVLLAATALVAGPAPADAATPEATYQRAAYKATNNQRAHHDLVRLAKQKCLQRFANRQAQRMVNRHRMFHQDLGPVMRACHLSRAGENVAYGYSSGTAAVQVGWMHSAPHRANILERRYRLMAIGARKSHGIWYAAQVFGRR